jgi:hypothetical protein
MMVLAVGLALGVVGRGRAAPPRVEADPNQNYPVTPAAGPWMISAAAFSSPEAPQLAKQLVYLLRSRYNLPAYVYSRGEEEYRRQMAEEDERIRNLPPNIPARRRLIRPSYDTVVLVGGYPSLDEASKALPAVRALPAPDLKLDTGQSALSQQFRVEPSADRQRAEVKTSVVNPFTTAMAVRNPTTVGPQATAGAPKFDPLWLKLNDGEDYCVYAKCPKPFTLVVKVCSGASMVQAQQGSGGIMGMLGFGGNKAGQMLYAAGVDAHNLAETLRKLKFDAYVLHTRTYSVVTIGGFDSEKDPGIEQLKHQLATLHEEIVAQHERKGLGKKDPLGLTEHPLPMAVPRAPR